MTETILEIKQIDRTSGEGVARLEDGSMILVPETLPGERVRVELVRNDVAGLGGGNRRGRLVELLERSTTRRDPVCRHYGVCGGCSLQLMQETAYLSWKRDGVISALADVSVATTVHEAVPVGEATRRRAVFGARRTKKTVQLGYRRRGAHELVDIEECPVLVSEITTQLSSLRQLIRPLLSRKGMARLTVLASRNGLDIAVDDVKPLEAISVREQIVDLASKLPIARLMVNDERLVEYAPPLVSFGDIALTPPSKAFLQATHESQQAMIDKVLSLLPSKMSKIVDLFSGLGTFTLPLAKKHRLLAVEMERGLLAALARAVDEGQGLKPVETLERDLYKMPLSAFELRNYDAVVLDPPRAGAKDQVSELAQSTVPTLVYVSCNPTSFARDAKTLVQGGYRLSSVTPFDQFLYTSHVELVGHFEKV